MPFAASASRFRAHPNKANCNGDNCKGASASVLSTNSRISGIAAPCPICGTVSALATSAHGISGKPSARVRRQASATHDRNGRKHEGRRDGLPFPLSAFWGAWRSTNGLTAPHQPQASCRVRRSALLIVCRSCGHYTKCRDRHATPAAVLQT